MTQLHHNIFFPFNSKILESEKLFVDLNFDTKLYDSHKHQRQWCSFQNHHNVPLAF